MDFLTIVMTAATIRAVGYRPQAIPPTKKWARFLDDLHRERNWSQTAGFEVLREGLGLGPKSRSAYLALLSGKREPKAHERAYLVSYFGREPEDVPEAIQSPPDLAAALMALAEELAAVRQEREAWTKGVVAVLRSYAAGQVPAELLDALAPLSREVAQQ